REKFRKMIYMREKRAETKKERALLIGRETIMLRAAERRKERIAFIMETLRKDGYASTSDIRKQLGFGEDTTKRLLTEMAAEGMVERVYGGVKLPGVQVRGGALRRPRRAA